MEFLRTTGPSADLKCCGSQAIDSVQSLFRRGVPRRDSGPIPATLRHMVRTAAHRTPFSRSPAQCRPHHHRNRAPRLQGVDAHYKGASGPGKFSSMDTGLENAHRRCRASAHSHGRSGTAGPDGDRRMRSLSFSQRGKRHRLSTLPTNGLAPHVEKGEDSVFSNLRSSFHICYAVECWGRRGRVGHATASSKRLEGLQKVFANEAANAEGGIRKNEPPSK